MEFTRELSRTAQKALNPITDKSIYQQGRLHMMGRSKIKAAMDEALSYRGFDALPECEESTAEEIHALIENEKDDFITFEEYAKRRGIKL
jgi:rubrerythrin